MDKLKKWIGCKKVDNHFKKSGPGQRLSGSTVSNKPNANGNRVTATDVAGQAALDRLSKNDQPQISAAQKKIQMIARRELEEERRKKDSEYTQECEQRIKGLFLTERGNISPKELPSFSGQKSDLISTQKPRQIEAVPTKFAVPEVEHNSVTADVYFTCELLGEENTMTKPELRLAIGEHLMKQIALDPDDFSTPALLLCSVNNYDVIDSAVSMIDKYLQNIIDNPSEPKFRRIRVGNKIFQELLTAKGALEFVNAVGFRLQQLPLKDGDQEEPFYVMPDDVAENIEKLKNAKQLLLEKKAVPIKVVRNVSIFELKANEPIKFPKVSSDFYDVTFEEVRRAQQQKTEEVNKLLTLRTKEMRERDEKRRQYLYRYSLFRIRLPDGYVIQGTFACNEPLSAVRTFISEYLTDELQAASWSLHDGRSAIVREDLTIGELQFAPTALLHVNMDEKCYGNVLAEKYREMAVPLKS